MIFRCTLKLRRTLGLRDRDLLVEPANGMVDLAEWYSNLVVLARQRCWLFTHALSLFSFLVPADRKVTLAIFGDAFRDGLRANLVAEDFSSHECSRLLWAGPDSFCRARDRHVLGSMTDHAICCAFHVGYLRGLNHIGFLELSHRLNEAPMRHIGMRPATEALRELLRAGPHNNALQLSGARGPA